MTTLTLLYQQYIQTEPNKYVLSKNPKILETTLIDNHDISLMITLNREAKNKMDERDLLYNLREAKQQDREERKRKQEETGKPKKVRIFEELASALPFMKEYKYVGKNTTGKPQNKLNKTENIKNEQYFKREWENKGLVLPSNIQNNCICCKDIRRNFFIFNIYTHRMYIIGSECIRRFGLSNRCKECDATISVDKHLRYDGLCSNCRKTYCAICDKRIYSDKKVCRKCRMPKQPKK